jgi:hypothetical protein
MLTRLTGYDIKLANLAACILLNMFFIRLRFFYT